MHTQKPSVGQQNWAHSDRIFITSAMWGQAAPTGCNQHCTSPSAEQAPYPMPSRDTGEVSQDIPVTSAAPVPHVRTSHRGISTCPKVRLTQRQCLLT